MSKVQAAPTPATVTLENLSATVENLKETLGLTDNHGRIAVIDGERHVVFFDKVIPCDKEIDSYPDLPESAVIETGEITAHDRMINLAKAMVKNNIAYEPCMMGLNVACLFEPESLTFGKDGLLDVDEEDKSIHSLFEEIDADNYLSHAQFMGMVSRMGGM